MTVLNIGLSVVNISLITKILKDLLWDIVEAKSDSTKEILYYLVNN